MHNPSIAFVDFSFTMKLLYIGNSFKPYDFITPQVESFKPFFVFFYFDNSGLELMKMKNFKMKISKFSKIQTIKLKQNLKIL